MIQKQDKHRTADVAPTAHTLSCGKCLVFIVKKKCQSLSHVQLFATPWTIGYQAPLSMEFSRPDYWSGQPFPSPGDLNPEIKPESSALQADSLLSEPPGKPRKFNQLLSGHGLPFPKIPLIYRQIFFKTAACFMLHQTEISNHIFFPCRKLK